MLSLDSDFSSIVGKPMLVKPILAVSSAIRKITRIVSRTTLLETTVKKNIRGAPMRSAKIPNQIEALNPTMIKKRAIRLADRVDKA